MEIVRTGTAFPSGTVPAEMDGTRFSEIETGRDRLDALVGDDIRASPVETAAAMLILCTEAGGDAAASAPTEAAATLRLIFRARRDEAGSDPAAVAVDEAAAAAAASLRSSFGRIEGARGGTSDGARNAACIDGDAPSPAALICESASLRSNLS